MRKAIALSAALLLTLPFVGEAKAHPRHRIKPRWARAVASYEGLNGDRDACGTIVNEHTMGTASHYPCGTQICVRYRLHTVCMLTLDHGPYVPGRSLDIWWRPARKLGFRSGAAFGVRSLKMWVRR